MKAIQIVELSGPDGALRLVDLAEPQAPRPMTPDRGVVIDVHAASLWFVGRPAGDLAGDRAVSLDNSRPPGSKVRS